MQDKELYQQILGLRTPWSVGDVRLDPEAQEIVVRVEHPRGTRFPCPECDAAAELVCYDHGEERRWRHLDSCQFKTILVANVPRVNCPEHGVKSVAVPWAQKHSRFTILFERLAIDVLLSTQTVQGAMQLLRIKWDQTWNIVARAVARGQGRKVAAPLPHVGLDEKAFAKGHKYITLLYDLDRSTVEAIAPNHDAASAKACFSQLSPAQIDSIEAIAMDMSPAYVQATREVIPEGETKIVHDRFHVMQLATRAVDQVRRREHKQLSSQGDDCLAKTRFLWLKSQEHLTDSQKSRFEAAYHQRLETGKAWAFKELLRDLWHHDAPAAATAFFRDWYRRVIHTTLTPLKKVARTIKSRLAQVVSDCTHKITNAVAEGMNSKIMSIKRRVGGYRNLQNFQTAILFHCGGLDLHPR